MKVEEARRLFGFDENKQLAQVLGKAESTVSGWNKDGEIPAAAEKKIEKLLGKNNVLLSGYATKKADHNSIAEIIIGITDKLSPEGQAAALQAIMPIFIGEQTAEKS